MRYLSIIVLVALLAQGCSSYQAALKSKDMPLKEKTAMALYEKKEYEKAIPLFEELLAFYKGNKKGEELYYYYCYCFFGAEEYLLAAYNFKSLATNYPSNPKAEECLFMSAKCHFYLSPRSNLDQTSTIKAINELQLFINEYPQSKYVSEANDIIEQLRRKLEKKDFDAAKLYFDMEDYKAATTAFASLLRKYPDSPRADQICYLSLKSSYLLAIHSIEKKKADRLGQTMDVYSTFATRFPNSQFMDSAKEIYENCKKLLEKNS